MIESLSEKENSKQEEVIIPPILNTLLPRLIPKEGKIKISTNNFQKENFISRKRKNIEINEDSKYKKIFNSIYI